MQRISISPRSNWKATVEKLGFGFHTIDGLPYWDETAAYKFTSPQIDTIEEATNTLEELCLEAVDHVISKGLYHRLNITGQAIDLIETSWRNQHKNLYGRFDFAYNGQGQPKLLEYNADTPTALLEASVIQWQWLEETRQGADQFNSIHEKLIEAWPSVSTSTGKIYFSCASESSEDLGTVLYLQDTAIQAGIKTNFIAINDLGWNSHSFVDLEDQAVDCLFKLYPWEWMMADEFAGNIMHSTTQFIEPAWKMLLSNKAILSILWQLFPNHPNLLPAYHSPEKLEGAIIRKPFLSREGANIRLTDGNLIHATSGPYGQEGYVYQQAVEIPNFDNNYPIIGSWVIASKAAGIGIREDNTPITRDTSRFIPHFFVD